MSFDLVHVNIRNSLQRNPKVGRKPFNTTENQFSVTSSKLLKLFLKISLLK